MHLAIGVITIALAVAAISESTSIDLDDSYYKLTLIANVSQTIRMNGFDYEVHTVRTEDGYNLNLYRIVNPFIISSSSFGHRYPFILFHGLGESAQNYLSTTNGWFDRQNGVYREFDKYRSKQSSSLITIDCSRSSPKMYGRNIAFMLATCGFDVWLANVRDNIHQASHSIYGYDDQRYWNVTIDHYTIDARANIDYVRNTVRSNEIGIICYSISCLSIYQLMSKHLNYNQILQPLFSLGPFIYIHSMLSLPLISTSLIEPLLRNIHQSTIDLQPILPYLANQINRNEFFFMIYQTFITLLAGYNGREFMNEYLYRLVATFPNTISLQVLAHVGQRYQSERLNYFDYGPIDNYQVYGSITPPYYDLNSITNENLYLWHGSNDLIADEIDIERLQQTIKFRRIFHNDYSHFDYINGRTVNDTIIKTMFNILTFDYQF